MPFSNSCFISYSSGDGELMETFIPQVEAAFTSSLGPYLKNMPVFLDQSRLEPGTLFNITLARNICESLCMIVIYTPTYRQSDYCRKEFETMRRLEAKRLEVLGKRYQDFGMILTIFFRGDKKDMPQELRSGRQILDFSKFGTADRRITKNRTYLDRVEKAAKYIWKVHEAAVRSGAQLVDGCDDIQLLPDSEVPDWGALPPASLPGRESGK